MYYIGIDLGGTNIVAGIVDEHYKLISKVSCKTAIPRPSDSICDDIERISKEALIRAGISIDDIAWVGIGAPGSVNIETGKVEYSANLYINDWDIRQMMQKRLNKDIFVENDANAAAYGEYLDGAAKGYKSALAITLGTGIGCGIIIDGNIYRGTNYNAAEMGHMVIVYKGKQCACGRKGCWETYASATGLTRLTKEMLAKNKYKESTIIWDIIKGDTKNIGGRTAYQAMSKGDKVGTEIVEQYTNYLGCGLVNAINIFQPDIICIGGGISKEGNRLLEPLNRYIERERYSRNCKKQTKLCIATLGNDAGIIGAAMLGNLK